MNIYNAREKKIRGWFKDHEAILIEYGAAAVYQKAAGSVERIIWQKPGDCNCLVDYMVRGNQLFVSGDLGSAVYRWGSDISLEWCSRCSLSYFSEKCEASEVGRSFVEWNEKTCEESAAWLAECWYDNQDPEPGKSWNELTYDERMSWLDKYAIQFDHDNWSEFACNACGSAHDWNQFISDHNDHFDSENFDAGYVTHLRCQAHLVGLQMAVEQLRAVSTQAESTS